MERCMYNAMEVNLKDLMHAMVMYMGHSSVILLMVWTHTFDIVFVKISCRPSFSVASGIVCHTFPTKQGLGSSHANSPGGPTVMHVGHVWEVPCIHPARIKQGPKAMGKNGR